MPDSKRDHRLGWIGTGRMGYELVSRLCSGERQIAVYNRTRSRAEPLEELGATVVDAPTELADCDIVFTILADSDSLEAVTIGDDGLLSAGAAPSIVIDLSTVSAESSARVRGAAAERGAELLAAPVSGNPGAVRAGRASLVVSGSEDAYETALPYLEALGAGVTYAGDGEKARLLKLCHNLMLATVSESLAEIAVLAERGGVRRSALLDFINGSVLGSTFTRYKTPALVDLDFTPTFTAEGLRKDLDLGLDAAGGLGVPMPVAETVRAQVQALIDSGGGAIDFAALITLIADEAGLTLAPEEVAVGDGLASREAGDE